MFQQSESGNVNIIEITPAAVMSNQHTWQYHYMWQYYVQQKKREKSADPIVLSIVDRNAS